MCYKGYDKMTNYDNSDYSYENAYVGGDAYNYIINGTHATAFFVLAIGFLISGILCIIGGFIINNLSLTNSVVISEIIVQKDEDLISLQSGPYSFSLDGYFRQIKGECRDKKNNKNIMYSRYAVR